MHYRNSRYQTRGGNYVKFTDYNDFIKKYKGLKMYCPKSYKHIQFNVLKRLPSTEDGKFILDIITDSIFEKVYGKVQLIYSVINNVAVIENLLPEQILLDGFRIELDTYKGVPYRNKRDKFRIDMAISMGKD